MSSLDYLLSFSRWIANLGVLPLLLFAAFLLLPALVFFAFLLLRVTRVFETILQLLSNSISHQRDSRYFEKFLKENSNLPSFINLEVLPTTIVSVKGLKLSFSILFTTLSAVSFGQMENQEVKRSLLLARGEIMTQDTAPVSRFSVGNKEVIRIKAIDGGKQILIKALSLGHSDLILWRKGSPDPLKFNISVLSKRKHREITSLKHSLESYLLPSRWNGGKIEATAPISDIKAYQFITQLNPKKRELILGNSLVISDTLKSSLLGKFYQLLHSLGLLGMKCSLLKLTIMCENLDQYPKEKKFLANSFLIKSIPNSAKQSQRLFKVSLYIKQFESATGDSFSLGLDGVRGSLLTTLSESPLELLSKNEIKAEHREFKSSTLAEPQILATLAEELIIKVGQEISYNQLNTNGVSTRLWRFAGLRIKLMLKTLKNKLVIRYRTEVSKPSAENISQNLQESTAIVDLNREVVLFNIGLTLDQDSLNAIPIIHQIPFFGSLFKGREKEKTFKRILAVIKVEEEAS